MKKTKKYKDACCHVALGSTFATALFHFVCCGLPALLALGSAIFGLSAVPAFDFISSTQRTYLLIVSGALLALSSFLYWKERKCCEDVQSLFWKKIILFSAIGFFLMGLTFHLISLTVLAEPACH